MPKMTLYQDKSLQRGRKIRLVENSVERVARMLSQQYGIRVVWKPGTCKTDGNTIYLPTLPDDAPDELLEAVQGYLDHETAHILFTDFKAVKNSGKSFTKHQFDCINSCEDVRIEAAIGKVFPGSPYNLRKSHEWVYKQIELNWESLNQFQRVCTAYFDNVKYGETEFWKDCVDSKTKELVEKCKQVVGSYDQITSTSAAIDAGLRMFSVIEEFVVEEPPKSSEEETEGKSGKSKGSAQGAKQQAKAITNIGDLAQILSSTSEKVVEATTSGAKTELTGGSSYTHDLPHDQTYIIYSTQYDTISNIPDTNLTRNSMRLQRLRDNSQELVSVIRAKLVNSLRALAKRRWVGNKEEGKIDSRNLYKAMLGLSDFVFKQRTDKLHFNTVVGLAIDHSGSMAGRKLELAAESAIVLGDVLNTLHIPFMCYGYSTERPQTVPNDITPYARWGALWIRYYRDFNESWEQGAIRLATAEVNVKENTLDGESVKHGIQRLLSRPEKRKILFVFNDGMPEPGAGDIGRNQQHLRNVVASASSSGVEIVAFGIHNDVSSYYTNSVIINNLNDLIKQPLQVIDQMLRKGVKVK